MQDLDPPQPTASVDAIDQLDQPVENPIAPDGSRNRTGFGGWIVGIFGTLVVLAMLGVIGNVVGLWGRAADPTAEFAHAGNRPLVQAAMAGDAQKIRELQQNNESPDSRGDSGRTPLMWAVQRQDSVAVTNLLAAGADPKLVDSQGHTALHLAAALSSTTMLSTLLEAGIDPSLRNTKTGDTAMADAITSGHPDMVAVLISHRVDLNAANNSGATALHQAAQAGQLTMVLQLLAAGADPKVVDHQGVTFQKYLLANPVSTTSETVKAQLAAIDAKLGELGVPILQR